jgi:pyruvate-formate lyase-activating enzyme
MSDPNPTAPAPTDPKAAKRANWKSYEENAAAGALHVSNKPVQLYLEITSRCNLRCVKCGFHWDPYLAKTGKDIPWPLLAKMEDFFAAATEVYTFGYGEMFLYPELAPLITVLKNHHCRVSGVTNGTLIRPADVVWLVATGYDQLTFSIDGSTEETMEKLRGASHAKVMNVLRLIHEEKARRKSELPRIVVNFVAQADNYLELPELVRQLAPLGIYFLGVNPLHHFTGDGGYHRYYQELRLGHVPKEAFEAVVAEARATAEGAGMLFDVFLNPAFEWPAEGIAPSTESLHIYTKAPTEAEVAAEAARAAAPEPPAAAATPEPLISIVPPPPATAKGTLPPMYCHYPWTTMYIAAAGTAKVCCYMSVFESSLGSFIGEGGLEGVWNGPGLQSVREHIRDGRVHPACAQCVIHRSFESHSAAMNPLRVELAVPPEPVPPPVVPPAEPPAPPAEPEPTGLRRILRRFHRPLTEPPSGDSVPSGRT